MTKQELDGGSPVNPTPHALRTTLLAGAAVLMWIGALGYTMVLLPDLHGDLVELGVRPMVLGGTVLHLRFAAAAMFGFAVIVSAAAIQSFRRAEPQRLAVAVVAVVYGWYGVLAFSRSHNPHHLGPIATALLIAAAIAFPSKAIRSAIR